MYKGVSNITTYILMYLLLVSNNNKPVYMYT